ncbi:MAG: hypothetical protein E6Q88_12440 [Lysobacteraceae bacterium]|nr:MAG: hypothetical protein E6Q88_12440 [Xanthomonadaceae bacterium]
MLFGWMVNAFAGEKAPTTTTCKQSTAAKTTQKACREQASKPSNNQAGKQMPPARQTAAKPPQASKQDMGPGAVVWLDTEKKIFYCPEHPSFGNTSKGYLIPEEHAKARGGRAFKGISCS